MRSWGRTEGSRADLGGYSHGAVRVPSFGSQGTTRMGPITRSFKLYNLQSHMRKLVEDKQKCLVTYSKKCNRRGKAQATITAVLNHSGLTRFRLMSKQVKGKWNRMKRNHGNFTFVLKQTGSRLRPKADTIEGTDEAWANLMRVNPKLQRFKTKGWPYYHILGHIFNRSTTTSALTTPLSMNPQNSDKEQNLERALIDGTVHINLETVSVFNAPLEALLQNNQPAYVLYKRISHESCNLGSQGKTAKLESQMRNACRAMTNLCNSKAERSSSSHGYQQEPLIN
ncbi:hypothetical protein CJ030_MR4G006398 [Morella rubra]|uniref:Myb/SANT-like domain-containing protein n=1 Tax=Morella rubra TaxID=262757 RepID=A0A6A1VT22_9ROSI|nr:hypothetical protein CJ030_MR4G006398 [Morella rubra]